MIEQFGPAFYPIYILDSLNSEVVQEHQTISRTRGYTEIRSHRVSSGRDESLSSGRTRDGSKRSKKEIKRLLEDETKNEQ